MEVLVTPSCLTLCDPMDCSPPDPSVHGIFQSGILEWVAISFSRVSSQSGIELKSPALQADSLSPKLPEKPTRMEIRKIKRIHYIHIHTHIHIYMLVHRSNL